MFCEATRHSRRSMPPTPDFTLTDAASKKAAISAARGRSVASRLPDDIAEFDEHRCDGPPLYSRDAVAIDAGNLHGNSDLGSPALILSDTASPPRALISRRYRQSQRLPYAYRFEFIIVFGQSMP